MNSRASGAFRIRNKTSFSTRTPSVHKASQHHPKEALPQIRYRRLGYAALKVTDLSASRIFIRDLMGLKIERRMANRVAPLQ